MSGFGASGLGLIVKKSTRFVTRIWIPKRFSKITPIPVPATVLLFSSGLLSISFWGSGKKLGSKAVFH